MLKYKFSTSFNKDWQYNEPYRKKIPKYTTLYPAAVLAIKFVIAIFNVF